ncbi:MAG: hypothetical protein ABIH04_10735 [Planctomycetota bacterium]
MSEENKKVETKLEESVVIEKVKQELVRERVERAKAGRLVRLERAHILFVLFMLTVCILGAVILLEMSYKVAAIIGGVAAMVMVIGLIMSPQKSGEGKGGS